MFNGVLNDNVQPCAERNPLKLKATIADRLLERELGGCL